MRRPTYELLYRADAGNRLQDAIAIARLRDRGWHRRGDGPPAACRVAIAVGWNRKV